MLNLAAERVVLTRVVRIFKPCLSCICPLMYRDLWLFRSGGGCRLHHKLCLILYQLESRDFSGNIYGGTLDTHQRIFLKVNCLSKVQARKIVHKDTTSSTFM
jgi:hypothetical protein